MHNQEQPAFIETELPAYLDHWAQFADEQIMLPDSPIREYEVDRFRAQCVENTSRLADARETMLVNPSERHVFEWYARMGSTADLEGAEADLNFALSTMLNGPECAARVDRAMLLAGNIAQELGLLSIGNDAEGYFTLASKIYGSVITKYKQNLNDPSVRQALAHNYDTVFARLSYARRDGLLSQEDFDKKYFDRHREYVDLCHKLADDKRDERDERIDIPDGELYEFYGEVLLRHRLWARERFGDAEVRRSFSPRENIPHDNFNHGTHEETSNPLPSYALDLKLTTVTTGEDPEFLQLKRINQGVRYAKPVIKVVEYRGEGPLRKHVSKMTGIMAKSYRFEATQREEAELKTDYDQAALLSV